MKNLSYFAVFLYFLLLFDFRNAQGPIRRPNVRLFHSSAIEAVIDGISSRLRNRELATIFINTFPNTLDTTVIYDEQKNDTFVVTGDIPAMWLRDSTNQVWPYLPYLETDIKLKKMIQCLIFRQVKSVLLDPYANAFNRDVTSPTNEHLDDSTTTLGFLNTRINAMTNHIHERKYELDSLASVLRLSSGYFQNTRGDITPFDHNWISAIKLIVATIKEQQKGVTEETVLAYTFNRLTRTNTETLHQSRHCSPASRTGMSKSPFRPSDDACTFPFPIAANAMAVVTLRSVIPILDKLQQAELSQQCGALANEIDEGIKGHGIINGMFAYEVNGYGSFLLMDDANIPSLLSLPYLGYLPKDDPTYLNTRKYILSSKNPWYFEGTAAKGIGGPHAGLDSIWPMSIIMQAMTSNDDQEIVWCLNTLIASSARTGFLHETFHKNNFNSYTRAWFAWVNTLFGEFILTLARERPHLIF